MSQDLTSQYNKIITDFYNTRLNPSRIEGILKKVGEEGLSVARSECPVRTGILRDGNEIETSSSDSAVTLHFFNDVEYAGYVNDGTSRQSPQPFFDAGVETIKQKLDTELKEI